MQQQLFPKLELIYDVKFSYEGSLYISEEICYMNPDKLKNPSDYKTYESIDLSEYNIDFICSVEIFNDKKNQSINFNCKNDILCIYWAGVYSWDMGTYNQGSKVRITAVSKTQHRDKLINSILNIN